MAGISKTELSARRQRLLDELPKHGWDYAKAGIAGGYSPAYARTHLKTHVTKDDSFCQAVAAKRAEIEATDGEKIDRLVRSWEKIAHDPTVPVRDRLKAGELLGKYHAIFSERRVLEVAERQRVLSETEQEEGRRYLAWRFDTARLPGDVQALPAETNEQDPRQ